jgi:hypothetical protein
VLRLGRLAPVYLGDEIAGVVAAELPERIALADATAAMDALGDRERDLLGGHLQGRQRRGQMLGALPQGGRCGHQDSQCVRTTARTGGR